MKVNGKRILDMEMAVIFSTMGINLLGSTSMVSLKDSDNISGRTDRLTQEHFLTVLNMEEVNGKEKLSQTI